MAVICKHNPFGLCKKCAELKPYTVFRTCKKQCFACNECGYFWGSDHKEKDGQRIVFPGTHKE